MGKKMFYVCEFEVSDSIVVSNVNALTRHTEYEFADEMVSTYIGFNEDEEVKKEYAIFLLDGCTHSVVHFFLRDELIDGKSPELIEPQLLHHFHYSDVPLRG